MQQQMHGKQSPEPPGQLQLIATTLQQSAGPGMPMHESMSTTPDTGLHAGGHVKRAHAAGGQAAQRKGCNRPVLTGTAVF